MNTLALCNFEGPQYFIVSSNVPSLVYYSHIPLILISFGIALLIFFKDRYRLSNQVLLYTLIPFGFWVFFSLLFWANNRSDIIMTAWALTLLVEPLIYIGSLYLFQVLIIEKDVSFKQKLMVSLLYLPIVILLPTTLTLSGFDITTCLSIEGPIALYYTYFIEGIYIICIIVSFIKEIIRNRQKEKRKKATLIFSGIILFLIAFSWGNIIGSFTDNWTLGEFGLLGMPVFMGFLAYNIVRFRLFNLKLIGANVLVLTLWILTGSLLAIQDIDVSHAVTAITLIISLVFGLMLIRSVKNEVFQRERIEALAADLTAANTRLKDLDKQKSEFVSFATHQLRAPLTAMRGYTSLMLEGEMGDMNPEVKQAVSRISESSKTLTNIVDDYLNISRIELGTMKYSFNLLDLRTLIVDSIGELQPNIDKKRLNLTFTTVPAQGVTPVRFMVHADPDKLKQVINNIIDNSVKYTPRGTIAITLTKNIAERKVLFSVKDDGVGVSASVMPKLFTKFTRAENANKENIYGTGLGLYIAKEIVVSHHGKLWAESEGEGKGTTFFMELDMEV